MHFKYIIIGLPGSGKTTAIQTLASQYYPNLTLFNVDANIKVRLDAIKDLKEELANFETPDALINDICKRWCQKYDKATVLRVFTRDGFLKHSSATMELLGEDAWRDLEAELAADFLKQQKNVIFDLGAKQPLHPLVQSVFEQEGFECVFLDVNESEIQSHLTSLEGDGRPRWQHISNYQAAGEFGWQALAKAHREEREHLYRAQAKHVLIANNLSPNAVAHRLYYICQPASLDVNLDGASSSQNPVLTHYQLSLKSAAVQHEQKADPASSDNSYQSKRRASQ